MNPESRVTDNTIMLRLNSDASLSFMRRILEAKRLNSLVFGSGQPLITGSQLKNLTLAIPPLDEQRAIATALSDVDALLDGLDRLIAKKRDLKQAAMQQLLTGKTRLPGFEGEWEVKQFSELTSPGHSRIDPSRCEPHNFCVELEHIDQGSGSLLGWTETTHRSSLKATFNSGDVLFGKLRAYLRKYWLANREGVCSTEIWVLSPNQDVVTSGYLFQIVQMDWFIEAASTAYGTHMPRSDWKVVKELELRVPPVPEQTAIATVLSDMDAEITALEQRRNKTKDIKQAMMQELLTGKTRLVTPGGSNV
jgi:type I restriction enzyme S subunit